MDFRDELTQGKIRAAEKLDGHWIVNVWVKQGILLGFRLGELSEMAQDASLSFVDKDNLSRPPIHRPRPGAYRARRIVGSAGRLCRAYGDLHATHVYKCGRIRGRRHHGGLSRTGGFVRADWQAGCI